MDRQLLLTCEPEAVRRFRAKMVELDAAPYLEPRPVPDPLRPAIRNPFDRSFRVFFSKYFPGMLCVELHPWQIKMLQAFWIGQNKYRADPER